MNEKMNRRIRGRTKKRTNKEWTNACYGENQNVRTNEQRQTHKTNWVGSRTFCSFVVRSFVVWSLIFPSSSWFVLTFCSFVVRLSFVHQRNAEFELFHFLRTFQQCIFIKRTDEQTANERTEKGTIFSLRSLVTLSPKTYCQPVKSSFYSYFILNIWKRC